MSNVTINQLPTYTGSVDPANDLLPIYQNSTAGTYSISRNAFLALASAPVGLSDTQTLTNKTLTSPTLNTPMISSPTLSGTLTGTYTIGGTPTFPSSVVQLASTQTLTNKTLTAPVITNASITMDSVVGYTTSNAGTVYGVPIASGLISGSYLTSASITGTQLATGAVGPTNIATGAITLGVTVVTSGFSTTNTSATLITGMTCAVTIPSGGRHIKITAYANSVYNGTGASEVWLTLWDGTVGSGTQLAGTQVNSSSQALPAICMAIVSPAAGSKTYNVGLHTLNASDPANIQAATTYPMFILVEAI